MKRDLSFLTAINAMAIFLLVLSGYIPNEAVSTTVFYLSFIIPILLGIFFIALIGRLEGRNPPKLFAPKKRVLLSFNFLAPSIGAIMLCAFVTNAILAAFGYEAPPLALDNLCLHIFTSAILPATLEELLFRYIPMKLLLPNRKRICVAFSAIAFAFIHLDIFKMPYALVAGIIFILIDIYAESVIPSILIHFLNNLLSLIISYGYLKSFYPVGLLATIILLCIISLAVALVKRRQFKGFFSPLFSDGE